MPSKRGPMTPEAKAAWQASIAANPANHKPASGTEPQGDGMGPGWGGPAGGAGGPFAGGVVTAEMKANKALRVEAHLDNLHGIAFDLKNPAAVRAMASDKSISHLVGSKVKLVGGDEDDNPIDTKVTIEFVRPK